jgi:Patatin-like phospholipase
MSNVSVISMAAKLQRLTIPCRAVLAVERRKNQDDELHAFTSYYPTPHHEQTLGRSLNPSNPKCVYIRDAARATSAAPGFFQEADVNGNVYMDGALKVNNPSRWAWDEAWRKYPERSWQAANGHNGDGGSVARELSETNCRIGTFISVGTGFRAPQSAFHRGDPLRSIRAVLRKAVSNMTDCENVHNSMEALAEQHHCQHYYRFNPPGLETMRLDQCLSQDRTFRKMENECNDYLLRNEVQRMIRECAAQLVWQRRSRCSTEELLQFHDLTIPGPRRW